MSSTQRRWVLAFDASCAMCRQLSGAVARASAGRLEIMPLTHPDVRQWREQNSGSRTAWTPTLIRVDGARAITWTGTAMGIRLVRHLGLRPTIRVLGAVGQLRRQGHPSTPDSRAGVAVVQLLAGLAVVGSLIMAKTPASGGSAGGSPRAWAEANRDRLPRDYDEVTAHALPYRKAIFSTLEPDVRAQLWVEHLNRYRTAHPDLLDTQIDIIDRAIDLVSKIAGAVRRPAEDLQALESAAMNAFGRDEARALLTTLGPDSGPAKSAQLSESATPDCDCANYSDWCGSGTGCTNYPRPCVESSSGCGTFWTWECNGICQPPLAS